MTLLQRQQKLIQQISTINDEDILIMLEEELSYHSSNKINLAEDLSPEDLRELTALADDTSEDNFISLSEYRKATERWRTK